MQFVKSYTEFLLENTLNEVGEGVTPFPWKSTGARPEDWDKFVKLRSAEATWPHYNDPWVELPTATFTFKSDKAEYYVNIEGECKRYQRIFLPGGPKPPKVRPEATVVAGAAFGIIGAEKEEITNLGEQFRVISTVSDILLDFCGKIIKKQSMDLYEIQMNPKLEDSEEGKSVLQSKRGRIYMAYIQKQAKKLPGDWIVKHKDDSLQLISGTLRSLDPEYYTQITK
jgi:hypothetical protein